MTKYIVKKGDTLTKIANEFKTTVADIQKANASLIKNVNKIETGWTLNIPNGSEGSEKSYEAIGRAFEKCWNDMEDLESFKELMELMG